MPACHTRTAIESSLTTRAVVWFVVVISLVWLLAGWIVAGSCQVLKIGASRREDPALYQFVQREYGSTRQVGVCVRACVRACVNLVRLKDRSLVDRLLSWLTGSPAAGLQQPLLTESRAVVVAAAATAGGWRLAADDDANTVLGTNNRPSG